MWENAVSSCGWFVGHRCSTMAWNMVPNVAGLRWPAYKYIHIQWAKFQFPNIYGVESTFCISQESSVFFKLVQIFSSFLFLFLKQDLLFCLKLDYTRVHLLILCNLIAIAMTYYRTHHLNIISILISTFFSLLFTTHFSFHFPLNFLPFWYLSRRPNRPHNQHLNSFP